MKLTDTLVSIILPVYNASAVLPRCIESLLRQTHQNIEILIVDDSSRDDSYKVASILKKCDSRIRLYRNKKRYGPATCFNRAMRQARGQFVAFMNPTDMASAQKLKKQVNFLLENPKVVAVGTQSTVVTETGKKERKSYPLTHEEIYPTLLHGISMRFETALINRHLLPKDLIRFTTNTYPFIFSNLFSQMLQYGKIVNLSHHLYTHYEEAIASYKQQGRNTKLFSYLSLFLKSFAENDYRPSLRAFLEPLTSPVRTMFR